MNFEELLQLQVLKQKSASAGHLFTRTDEQLDGPLVRQMCAKVSVQLHDALDTVCDVLNMSKRQFIEAAVSDAVLKAEVAIKQLVDQEAI